MNLNEMTHKHVIMTQIIEWLFDTEIKILRYLNTISTQINHRQLDFDILLLSE